MTYRVHLLMTPGRVGAAMQALGHHYIRINDRYQRTGTLWAGRSKACLVDNGSYLHHCCRYIERNSIRARTSDAGDYR